MGDVTDATESALEAAKHLTDVDEGAVAALRALARKIDAWDEIVAWAEEDAAERKDGRPKVPANDNVSIATYLKFCESLGLTPTGRKALELKETARGKLAVVRDARERPTPSKKRA
jgi:hypothetical protein